MNTQKTLTLWLLALLTLAQISGCATVGDRLFSMRFVDAENGRGIPLVEIETIHGVKFVSDSAGYIAIPPFVAGPQQQFFFIRSHGYALAGQHPWDGLNVTVRPGGKTQIPLARINIAERLYRVTGEGIYNHAIALGVPLAAGKQNAPRGGVYGQDSVVNTIYGDQLYWFWGDTLRAKSPLGNLKVAGATSRLPQRGGENPDDGVELSYFTDESGFTRQMCPIPGKGVVWISGLTTLIDAGRERMLCYYSRRNGLEEVYEHGIAVWNDQRQVFEKVQELPPGSARHPTGHTIKYRVDDEDWLYFGSPFPDRRVKASMDAVLDPSQYEVFSFLREGSPWDEDNPPVLRDDTGKLDWQWRKQSELVDEKKWESLLNKGLVAPNESRHRLIDAETGEDRFMHHGHIAWNAYRQRWVLIAVELWGQSVLGEVWYAEAHSPMGPWSMARKILTHNSYSFYNVKQHPYFAQGKYVYFEGTYTKTFSGNTHATPRYDYNQIMYRLDLSDTRLPRMEEKAPGKNQQTRS